MTESPFVKAEGPEPPKAADILLERHQQVMSQVLPQVDDATLGQFTNQSVISVPATWTASSFEDTSNQYTYYREQLQPDREEIEQVRAEAYRFEMELARTRNKLALATSELNRMSNSVRRAESRLFDAYQLIGQLVGYLDSIEWGTHDEWTRSQSLRERAHEYLTGSNTIAT